MNKEQQRIKIAEACGWEYKTRSVMGYGGLTSAVQYYWSKNESVGDPPDYLNDLNAMHEAEKTLIFSKRQKYKIELQLVASNKIRNCMVCMNELIFATAAQRAEAFLRTLNLWEI